MTKNQSRLFVTGIIAIIILVMVGYLSFEKKLTGCFLGLDEMDAELGSSTLDRMESFGSASPETRSAFVKSLIIDFKPSYLGKSREIIENILGKSDGAFTSHSYANYALKSGWSLVFAMNKENRIREAFVWRQNCKIPQ